MDSCEGTVIKNQNGYFSVFTGQERPRLYLARSRGRLKRDVPVLVGDRVIIRPVNEEEAVIEKILPRKNELSRPPVANLDRIVLVASVKDPETDLFLFDKMIAMAEAAGISPVICISKTDLDPETGNRLSALYCRAGYPCFCSSSVNGDGSGAARQMAGLGVTAFSGASGTGKSTLLNRLLGADRFEAQAVSRKTGRGRNTTRHAELVPLDAETLVMDTPGYTALSAGGLLPSEAGLLFREFSPYLGQCRFSNCLHESEPGCAVRKACESGAVAVSRYRSYLHLLHELKDFQLRRYD